MNLSRRLEVMTMASREELERRIEELDRKIKELKHNIRVLESEEPPWQRGY